MGPCWRPGGVRPGPLEDGGRVRGFRRSSDVCARAGVFAAAARLVGRASHGRPDRLFLGVFLLAALVTTVLSLDATVVLLTPVVVAAAAALGTSDRPGAFACLRMANSASLLLPVSNLTNLLALPLPRPRLPQVRRPDGAVLLVVLVVEYVGLRLLFRGDLAAPQEEHGEVRVRRFRSCRCRGGAMLVGFAVLSPWGVAPAWVSSAAVEQFVDGAKPDENGLATVLVGQRVGSTRYFDAAGFPGRTVGMDERKAASR